MVKSDLMFQGLWKPHWFTWQKGRNFKSLFRWGLGWLRGVREGPFCWLSVRHDGWLQVDAISCSHFFRSKKKSWTPNSVSPWSGVAGDFFGATNKKPNSAMMGVDVGFGSLPHKGLKLDNWGKLFLMYTFWITLIYRFFSNISTFTSHPLKRCLLIHLFFTSQPVLGLTVWILPDPLGWPSRIFFHMGTTALA